MADPNEPRTITVRCFAALRDAAGADVLQVELPGAGDVSDLRRAILQDHPSLRSLLSSTAVAVNLRLVGDDAVLQEGDEVALLPPVSGG